MAAKGRKWLYVIIGITAVLVLVLIILITWIQPFLLVFLLAFIFWMVLISFDFYHRLKPTTLFSEHLAYDFKTSLQYTIVEERALTVKEAWEAFEPLSNGLPASFPNLAYKNYGRRYFKVEDLNGYHFELIVTIIQTWKDKFRYRIESTSRIRE